MKDHLESAQEFYEIGLKEYTEGKHFGDLTRMQKGCEKVFHAYIEACSALIQKHGLPEPEDHKEKFERLDKLRETTLINIGDSAFLYLHRYGYYLGIIRPQTDKIIKQVEEAIKYVHRKTRKA